ncbi:hypothetical protein ACROYT_G012490 [Oculina patagonica]
MIGARQSVQPAGLTPTTSASAVTTSKQSERAAPPKAGLTTSPTEANRNAVHLTQRHISTPYLTSPDLTVVHLASPCLTSPRRTTPYHTKPLRTSPHPHVTSRHHTTPRLTSPHLTSPLLTSPHLTLPNLTSPNLTSPHLTSPHLTSPHLTSPHLTSPHLTSPHLTLSQELNGDAQRYAHRLARESLFEHDPNNKDQGENIGIECAKGSDADLVKKVVDSWYFEVCDYNFNSGTFSGGTGHFTQVVWKGSTQLGIGFARGSYSFDGKKRFDNCLFVVGRYKEPGNMMNAFKQNVFKGSFKKEASCPPQGTTETYDDLVSKQGVET